MGTTETGPGSPKPDSAGDPYAGIVDPAAIRRGHEADSYDSRSVLSVPALVIFFFVLAFSVVSVMFYYVSQSPDEPNANPLAVKQNARPLNEQLNEIRIDGPVNQPRLEPLVMREGPEKSITSPPTPKGNSPEIHPEDIVPSKENTPELFSAELSKRDPAFGRIPIDDAMKLAFRPKGTLFPVQAQASAPLPFSRVPNEANAGRGFGPSAVETPKTPPAPIPPKGGK